MLFSNEYLLVIAEMSAFTHAIIVSLILHISVGENPGDARITEWVNERFPDGSYHFRYITSNGLEREETGTVEGEQDKAILRIKGFYSYFNNDGETIMETYEADENGYKIEAGKSDQNVPRKAIATLAGGDLDEQTQPVDRLLAVVKNTLTGGGQGEIFKF